MNLIFYINLFKCLYIGECLKMGSFQELKGQVFSRLTVLKRFSNNKHK